MKKFINSPEHVVSEMLDGLVVLDPRLKRLSGYNVLVRADAEAVRNQQVALISGGGSGHEPAHAGYIGEGMLSAAVAGEVFTSPSTDAVYAAIRAVGGRPGVLLIVKNYTGDRLNFGLAAEMARADGIPVEMVIVADDVALDASRQTAGARGIAGTVLIHKIAGAAAAKGASLLEVKAAAEAASTHLGSMGVSLSAGTSPMVGKPSFVLGDDEMELGLGIHGEPGVSRMPLKQADPLVEQMLERILATKRFSKGARVVLLANNLGATTPMELAIVVRHASAVLEKYELVVERTYAGTFLSSLDMAGFSLSLLSVDHKRLEYLDTPTTAVAWPNAPKLPPSKPDRRTLTIELSPGPKPVVSAPTTDGAKTLQRAIQAVCSSLIMAEPQLTELDRLVGDGDLGVSMERGAKAIQHALSSYPLDDIAGTLEALSHTAREALGGTSGPLYGVLFLRLANELRVSKSHDLSAWARAVSAAGKAMSDLGGAKAGDRTMLDSLFPFAQALSSEAAKAHSPKQALLTAVKAAEAGAEATAQMMPRRGRSSYLGERTLGHEDPGAVAITIALTALAEIL